MIIDLKQSYLPLKLILRVSVNTKQCIIMWSCVTFADERRGDKKCIFKKIHWKTCTQHTCETSDLYTAYGSSGPTADRYTAYVYSAETDLRESASDSHGWYSIRQLFTTLKSYPTSITIPCACTLLNIHVTWLNKICIPCNSQKSTAP
jgi:hypothetical protein